MLRHIYKKKSKHRNSDLYIGHNFARVYLHMSRSWKLRKSYGNCRCNAKFSLELITQNFAWSLKVICHTCFHHVRNTRSTLIWRSLTLKWRRAASWSRRRCLTALTSRRAIPADRRWYTLPIQEYRNTNENKFAILFDGNKLITVVLYSLNCLFLLLQPSTFYKFILTQYFHFILSE